MSVLFDEFAALMLPEATSQMPDGQHPAAVQSTILLVMGVSGSGKTTIGKMLAARLGLPFKEGDDFHPQTNIDKMRAGHSLDDMDRQPWLAAVAGWMDEQVANNRSGIIACSALKRSYRNYLREGRRQVVLIYLRGKPEILAVRLAHRHGHFMPASLLDSQFDTLEEPTPDENALFVDASANETTVIDQILELLGARTTEWKASCPNT